MHVPGAILTIQTVFRSFVIVTAIYRRRLLTTMASRKVLEIPKITLIQLIKMKMKEFLMGITSLLITTNLQYVRAKDRTYGMPSEWCVCGHHVTDHKQLKCLTTKTRPILGLQIWDGEIISDCSRGRNEKCFYKFFKSYCLRVSTKQPGSSE